MKEKDGSVSIEAAISMAAVLILVASVLSFMIYNKADIMMQRAVEETSSDIELIMPLLIPAGDGISTVLNALPENVGVDSDIVSELLSATGGLCSVDDFTDGELSNLILTEIFAGRIRDDIAANYSNMEGPGIVDLDSISVYLSVDDNIKALNIDVSYNFLILAGSFNKEIYSVVPVYGDFDLGLLNTEDDDGNDEIWNSDNFTRGNFFREKYGGNMPGNFPVVSSFKNGNITSIKSIDLTAPTYSDYENITETVTEHINNLAGFQGGSSVYNGTEYSISESEIRERTLLIVIPGNSPSDRQECLENLRNYAENHGVTLQIETYAESQRYTESD